MRHQTKRQGPWRLRVAAVIALTLLAPAAHATTRVDDGNILDAFRERLLESPFIGNEELSLTVNKGVLSMRGTVATMRERREALRLARAVKGVRAVVDQLQLPRIQRPDRTIAKEVRGALLFDPDTELTVPDAKIRVTVEDGRVTLRGTARSTIQRTMATEAAYGVRGVTAVDNELRVPQLATRPDGEIKRDVEQALLSDPHVEAALVQVSVSHGVVHLRGVLGSGVERDTAALDSWVVGVKDVSVSGLRVRGWARDPMLRTGPSLPADGQLRRSVRDALAADPRVPTCGIAVFVDHRRVGLSGEVTTPAGRTAAEQDARDTVGVRSVDDDIRIGPNVTGGRTAVCAG